MVGIERQQHRSICEISASCGLSDIQYCGPLRLLGRTVYGRFQLTATIAHVHDIRPMRKNPKHRVLHAASWTWWDMKEDD